MSTDRVWLVSEYLSPDFQIYDEQAVVYHCGNGQTHLLSLFGAEVLKILLLKPGTIKELTIALYDRFDDVDKTDVEHSVQQFLEYCRLLDVVKMQPDES